MLRFLESLFRAPQIKKNLTDLKEFQQGQDMFPMLNVDPYDSSEVIKNKLYKKL